MEKLKEPLIFWSIPIVFFAAWYLRHILLIVAAALIFGSAIQTWALWLKQRFRLPFLAGVFFVYLSLIIILAVTVYGLLPVLRDELRLILPNLETLLSDLGIRHDFLINQFISSSSDLISNLGPFLFSVLGGIFSAGLILILSFYITTHRDFYRHAIAFLPIRDKDRAERIWLGVRRKFAAWLVGQLILMLVIGLATFSLMTILGIPNAVLIGTIAALLEIVPILGPVLTAAIAILFTLASNPAAIWWVLIGFTLIQQIENNLLVPVVMKRAIAINPIFSLISIMIGGALGGILGVLTILPLVLFGAEIYQSLTGAGVACEPNQENHVTIG